MTPNTTYGGPHATKVSVLQEVPFTSDTAELNAVKAGKVDLGYVPLGDVPQMSSLTGTYNEFGYSDFGWSYVAYNFKDTTGDFNNIINKLYVRQAMAHLEDQAGYIKAFFNGAGGQAFGPVPSIPESPFTAVERHDEPVPVQPLRRGDPAEGQRLEHRSERHGHLRQAGHRCRGVRGRHSGGHEAGM